ncbi:MAG: HD domain-containing protein [Myxococcota bacterium]|jgi:hypothetical protein
MPDRSAEVFEKFDIWPPSPEPVDVNILTDGLPEPDVRFIEACYEIAQGIVRESKRRRNGESRFTHPTNVAHFVKMAGCKPHVIAAAILHDTVDEPIRLLIEEKGKDAEINEEELGKFVHGEILKATDETGYDRDLAELVYKIVLVLTHVDADRFYEGIGEIFSHYDYDIRLISVAIKLADRLHNIRTIENYVDEDRLYQCFKNVILLNYAKALLTDIKANGHQHPLKYVDDEITKAIELLFKKCGKATFQVLQCLTHAERSDSNVFPVLAYLSLGLEKYHHQKGGLDEITDGALEIGVSIPNLFHGIIHKYERKLYRDHEAFQKIVDNELEYCKDIFSNEHLTDDELLVAIHYKDALALGEVVALLLYKEGYVVSGVDSLHRDGGFDGQKQ